MGGKRDTQVLAREIFGKAIEIGDLDARNLFIEQSCDRNQQLVEKVQQLLNAHENAAGFLGETIDVPNLEKRQGEAQDSHENPTIAPSPSISIMRGTMIGPYKLLQQIGEGGMGTVWMAEQEKPVRRRVAVKIIRGDMGDRDIIARFEAERQALAIMDHQNIARVYDAGTTESGAPWFAMELVKGIPITKYCDDNELNIRERLKLMVPVCEAVQHAHHKGIVHRDLKPSNVLVTLYDGRAVPKVIDFGLAKALEHQVRLTDKTLFTEFGKVVGTLQYMSPEQAEMNALDVDTRTDVYSLGVLIYELLTGSTPIEKSTLNEKAILQVLALIRETEPPRPSTRLSQSADTIEGISKQRKISAPRLSEILRGELDWIVMRALEKDRTRRYETANGLARDIERYLDGDAIEARPPSTGYQLKKFVNRNRGPVIAATALVLALLLGVIGTSIGYFQAQTMAENERQAKLDAIDARNAEKAAREQAEINLVKGILRPIGFDHGRLNRSEARSLEDWSALPASRLKVNAFELALEDPETAFRIARRPERTLQACIGADAGRLGEVTKLLNEPRFVNHENPKIRFALVQLAISSVSFSSELQVSPQSLARCISDAAEFEWDMELRQLLETSLSSPDLYPTSENVGPVLRSLIEVIQNHPDDDKLLVIATDAIVALAERLNEQQVELALNCILKMPERSYELVVALGGLAKGLAALAPAMNDEQRQRSWNELLKLARPGTRTLYMEGVMAALESQSSEIGIEKFKERLPRIVEHAAFETSRDGLAAIARHMSGTQIQNSLQTLLDMLDSDDAYLHYAATSGLVALIPNLNETQNDELLNVLLELSKNHDKESKLYVAAECFGALAPFMSPGQVKTAWQSNIRMTGRKSDFEVQIARGDAYVALTAQLNDDEIETAWEELVNLVEEATDLKDLAPELFGLTALATKRAASKKNQTLATLQSLMEKSTLTNFKQAVVDTIEELAPILNSDESERFWRAVYDIESWSLVRKECFQALATKLKPQQIDRELEKLVKIIQKENNEEEVETALTAITALVSQRKGVAARSYYQQLSPLLNSNNGDIVKHAGDALATLSQMTPKGQTADWAPEVIESQLQFSASDLPTMNSRALVTLLTHVEDSQRILQWMQHPGSIGAIRQALLRRSTELNRAF